MLISYFKRCSLFVFLLLYLTSSRIIFFNRNTLFLYVSKVVFFLFNWYYLSNCQQKRSFRKLILFKIHWLQCFARCKCIIRLPYFPLKSEVSCSLFMLVYHAYIEFKSHFLMLFLYFYPPLICKGKYGNDLKFYFMTSEEKSILWNKVVLCFFSGVYGHNRLPQHNT